MTRNELNEKFCEALNKSNLGPFESTVYTELVFIHEVDNEEVVKIIRELKKLI